MNAPPGTKINARLRISSRRSHHGALLYSSTSVVDQFVDCRAVFDSHHLFRVADHNVRLVERAAVLLDLAARALNVPQRIENVSREYILTALRTRAIEELFDVEVAPLRDWHT